MAYVIFEGGGAKGYAHVGALKATEERGIVPTMVAGTSAGAIIACLVAAGYQSEELLSPDAAPGARGILDIDPAELLGTAEAAEAKTLQESIAWAKTTTHCKGFIVAVLRWRHRKQWKRLSRDHGLIETEKLERWLEEALQTKLGLARTVTFKDLRMPLRVIAADLITGSLREFGKPRDADLSVAKAVTASACYPLFFKPVQQGTDLLVDGGVVSNLPAWVFDDERDDDLQFVPTFGFRLVDEQLRIASPSPPGSIWSFLWRLIQTLQSGGQSLQERRIPDYFAVDLTANISTLSFDRLREEAPQLVREGYQCVRRYYDSKVGPQDPQRMQRVLGATVGELLSTYDEWKEDARIRASILLMQPGGRWAQTTYAHNMDDDADDRLRVKISALGLGTCLSRKEPVYFYRRAALAFIEGVSEYEQAARPTDTHVSYAIPLFTSGEAWGEAHPPARPEPFGALVIDKTLPIDSLLLDPAEQDALAHVSCVVGEELQRVSLTNVVNNENLDDEPGGFEKLDESGTFRVSNRKLRRIGTTALGNQLSRTLLRLNAGQHTTASNRD